MLPAPIHTLFNNIGRLIACLLLMVMPLLAIAQDPPVVDTAVVAPVEIGDADEDSPQVEAEDEETVTTPPLAPTLRIVPDSLVKRMQQTDTFAYANDPSFWVKEAKKPQTSGKNFWDYFYDFFRSNTARTITYIMLGAILIWILYRIVIVNNLFMTGRSRRREEELFTENEVEDANLEDKIAAAIQAGNYRNAIRFMYLLSLRSLQEKGWIRYHAQGTNYEYLSQVQPYGVGNEFRFLTHVYEYVWYGEFSLSQAQFQQVQQQFQQFFNAVKP